METFCDPDFAHLLTLHHLVEFDALWDLESKEVEDPNARRGGWSGVCRLCLSDGEGKTRCFFLKRQQNQLTHCGFLLTRRLALRQEYASILLCKKRNLPCPDVVLYCERKHSSTTNGKSINNHQAMLITPALDDFTPFSEIVSRWSILDETIRHHHLQELARLIADLHKNRLSHNALNPNHLFINLTKDQKIKMIDMERMSFQIFRAKCRLKELETVLRTAGVFSAEETSFFLSKYCHFLPSGMPFEKLKKSIKKRFERKIPRRFF
ncbi:MAG: hypothetical protein JXK94_11080 [Deltaproteobacteria bacterium]|nr:hypothetical protein [Deltaproteobacteria bacterium]